MENPDTQAGIWPRIPCLPTVVSLQVTVLTPTALGDLSSHYTRSAEYKRPLKKFLNDFMQDHRDLKRLPTDTMRKLFLTSANALAQAGARTAVRPTGRLNVAFLEAVFVVAMRQSAAGRTWDEAEEKTKRALEALASN